MPDIDSTVQTDTGRTLAYTQTGQEDGVPVFYFHGIPGSRLDLQNAINRSALDGLNVGVIGIDRPGFGESDYQPGRRYSDWPSDVLTVANHLGIDRFAILAYSGGAPYAIACALAHPERLTFVGIVSGDGTSELPNFRRGMGRTDAILTRVSRWAPAIARVGISLATKQAAKSPEKFSKQFDKELSAPDRAVHADDEYRQMVRDVFIESSKHGPRGVVEDYRIWANPSGLQYDQVEQFIKIWHGDADTLVPLHNAEYVAELLPKAELVVLPNVGHLHTPARWHEFLSAAEGLT